MFQGSYKFGTQVRPPRGEEFDIDLGIYFQWGGAPEDGAHGPKNLKAMVQDALERYERKTEDALQVARPPKKRCSRIQFKLRCFGGEGPATGVSRPSV